LKAIVVCLLLLAVPAAYVMHVRSTFLETIDKARSAEAIPAPKPPMQLNTQPLQINGPTTLCIGGNASAGKPGDCRNVRPVPPMANESLRHK
jgi:hypothetical protein